MPNYLRYQLFTDATRANYSPLGADIAVEVLPMYGQGESVELGDPNNPNYYRVANMSHILREPNAFGGVNVIYEVYLLKADQWDGDNDLLGPMTLLRDVV